MKRELKASRPVEIKASVPTKTQERELSDVMEYMVDQISKRFLNTAIKGIQAGTVEKFTDANDYVELVHGTPHVHFTDHVEYRHYDEYGNELSDGDSAESAKVVKHELKKPHTTYTYSLGRIKINDALSGYRFKDAQSGNYAAIFLKLAGKVTRMIMRQFDDKRLEEMVSGILDKVDNRSRDEFYGRIENAIGISSKELAATEGMKATTNALKLQTAEWVKKLRDETLDEYTTNTLRAMSLGNGLDGILDQYDGLVEKRRNHAKMTARSQINNYNAISTKIRAQNLGITQAVWVAAMDERTRHSHAVRDGKTFDLDKGLYSSVDGKWLLPGTDYQCFPGWSKLNYSSACNKLFRRWYTGELLTFVFGDGVILSTTPNHPIMTTNGFKAANLINKGDNIIRAVDKSSDIIKTYGYDIIPTMEQVFTALSFLGVVHEIPGGISGEFHGDITDGKIEVIATNSLLMREVDLSIVQKLNEFGFTDSDKMLILSVLTCNSNFASCIKASDASGGCDMSRLDLIGSLFVSHFSPLERFRFALGAWGDSCFDEPGSDCVSGDSKMFSDCVFAFAVAVHGADLIVRQIDLFRLGVISLDWNAKLFKLLTKEGVTNPNLIGGSFNGRAIGYHTDRVVDKSVADFSGHVYNLETVSNDYICQTAAVSNCRCTMSLIIPESE